MIEKELPIKVVFSDDVSRPAKFKQHIKRVRFSGPAEKFPEEIRLSADEIAEGGTLTIDDLELPHDMNVVGQSESATIVTVERPRKVQRGKQIKYEDD